MVIEMNNNEAALFIPRIGHGYDVHRLVPNRKLVLGGIEIPYEKGLLGHSDADVLTHAIMDSLLGAAALGDIGIHFPDSDERYYGADSTELAKQVLSLISNKGYKISNIDATIIAQKPKLKGYIPQMRVKLSETLKINISSINIKATTEEGLGFTGDSSAISAHAVSVIFKTTS